MESIDPSTGEVWQRYEELSDAALDEKIDRAEKTFRAWRRTPLAERATRLERAAELLVAERDRLAFLATREMGKTLASAVAEVEKCAWVCRHYAAEGARYLADETIATEATASYVKFLPLGPVLAVMPWNFPYWQVFRFAAPALMAGNVGLLKHASNVPGCALALEDILLRAGFPEGAFQTLLIGSRRVARVLGDGRVRAVTLTGSDGAGVAVATEAGRHLKKCVLELGGSDPFIVMPSAELDAAARTAVTARNINNGQSCIAAKRFIVHEQIYAEFERRFVDGLEKLRVGDPRRADTDVGPLATAQVLDDVARQVDESVKAGARLLCGGRRVPGAGFFYSPTALAEIPKTAPAYYEEVFGPVALLHRARSVEHAIEIANDSPFGLASSVWTRDPDEERRFVDELDAGATFVNAMVVSDPRLPFGGVKRSGYGRELAELGIREFTNIKTILVKKGAASPPQRRDEIE